MTPDERALAAGYTQAQIDEYKKKNTFKDPKTATQQFLTDNERWARPVATSIGGIIGGLGGAGLGTLLEPGLGTVGGAMGFGGAAEAGAGALYDELSGKGASPEAARGDALWGAGGAGAGPLLKVMSKAVPAITKLTSKLGGKAIDKVFGGSEASIDDVVRGSGSIDDNLKHAYDAVEKVKIGDTSQNIMVRNKGEKSYTSLLDEFGNVNTESPLLKGHAKARSIAGELLRDKGSVGTVNTNSLGSIAGLLSGYGMHTGGANTISSIATGLGTTAALAALKKGTTNAASVKALNKAAGKVARATEKKEFIIAPQLAAGGARSKE